MSETFQNRGQTQVLERPNPGLVNEALQNLGLTPVLE